MKRDRGPKAYASLRIAFRSKKQMNSIVEALKPELLHPAGNKARAKIVTRGRSLKLSFEAKDSTTLRAIFSSYLRMLRASLTTCNTLTQLESSQATESDKT